MNRADVSLSAYFDKSGLMVRCFDKFDEDTDALVGQSLTINASCGGVPTRIRQSASDPWSEYGLFRIEETQPGIFGFAGPLEVEGRDTFDLQLLLFGYSNLGTMLTVVRR